METGNPLFIVKGIDYFDMPKVTKATYKKLDTCWDELLDQYLRKFGLSEQAEKSLRLEVKIAKLKIKMVLTKDWGLLAAIRMEERKLKQDLEAHNKATFEETVAYVEKYQGKSIDAFTCSTQMFYTYVDLMNKQAKRDRANNMRKK